MDNTELEYWNIIENNFGIVDALDEEEVNIFNEYKNQAFTVINPAPGVIIMIRDNYYDEI
tara:strand:+ start:2046 stop:2225 length:180 start_codon:yes stop_codon:yes gene_type:complete